MRFPWAGDCSDHLPCAAMPHVSKHSASNPATSETWTRAPQVLTSFRPPVPDGRMSLIASSTLPQEPGSWPALELRIPHVDAYFTGTGAGQALRVSLTLTLTCSCTFPCGRPTSQAQARHRCGIVGHAKRVRSGLLWSWRECGRAPWASHCTADTVGGHFNALITMLSTPRVARCISHAKCPVNRPPEPQGAMAPWHALPGAWAQLMAIGLQQSSVSEL